VTRPPGSRPPRKLSRSTGGPPTSASSSARPGTPASAPDHRLAYQWNSRLIDPHYGWFTGYTALLAFMAGTAATAVALATVFASDIWKSPTHGDIVLFAGAAMVAAALINIISVKAVRAVNNSGVFFEISGSVVAAAVLFFGAIFFFHHDAGFHILVSTQRTSGGALWYGFILAALLPLYCFIGWEGAADLAEETNDPRAVTPFAMIGPTMSRWRPACS
jgi:amino acid transporter